MSLSRLSAGAGYKYLLRHTACGDVCREAGTALTAYYAAAGYPAGRWLGAGLAGLDGGRGIAAGTVVSEEAMAALYGSAHDPVAGTALGSAYPAYRAVADRIAEALAELPTDLPAVERAERHAEIEQAERARPTRTAVAGFDLTFTAPKSASVLWALGDTTVQQAVYDAHQEAMTVVLQVMEDRFLHTRVGAQGCAQVSTRGMVAAAFEHWDTRTGDPNLHTHVVIANKVQGPDGKWRSLDSRALHHATVACSELYDTLLADAIATRLPVSWSWRDRGERRSPAFEIDGLPDDLLAVFSSRSAQIAAAMPDLLAEFRTRHDREPTRREVQRLRQQATLATRPAKTVRPLAELVERWRAAAASATGRGPAEILDRAMTAREPVTEPDIAELATATVTGVQARRSTWTRANLLAEAARATRHVRAATPSERLALLDRVVDTACAQCVALDPPETFFTPQRFRRADGTSVFLRPDEHAFTTTDVLSAEQRLLDATADVTAPAVAEDPLAAVLAAATRGMPGARGLTSDQAAAVRAIATSGRRLDVLIGPAGSGKTRALRALRAAWENAHGPGSVIGLAPSATAAAELAASLRVGCETTAKWLHENSREHVDPRWTLAPGNLVVVDEASMVVTAELDRILAHADAAGAKVVLVGDDQQLGAVGAGGAFRLLAGTAHAQQLTELWRFAHQWEAEATRALRAGRVEALDAYAAHGRLHEGPGELMRDAAYSAWAADIAQGRSALLLAADRAAVTALNTRAHDERVAAGLVQDDGVPLADDSTAGRGDLVVTRRNNRALRLADGGHVRNGALWRITATHPDGALDVVDTTGEHPDEQRIRLPAEYVREHVELGYAATVHRAQGMTVDHCHVLASSSMTRQSLYVAMTRGREVNQVWVATDSVSGTCPVPDGSAAPTGRAVLQQVLATDGAELSATATLRRRQDDSVALRRLLPIRDLIAKAAHDPEAALALRQLEEVISARAREARAGWYPRPQQPDHHRRQDRDGLHR